MSNELRSADIAYVSDGTLPIEEALAIVSQAVFPAAVVGDTVFQWGHWFLLTESGWVPRPE
jgi:hypothetical protein